MGRGRGGYTRWRRSSYASTSFWGRLHPGIRSAVILWVFLLVVALVNSLTGGASVVFCYPVQLLLYVGNGALAGFFAVGSGYRVEELAQVGAVAGLVAWLLPTLYYVVFGLILGLVTLGAGLFGVAAWLLCGPVDLAVQAVCGAFGGWLYGRLSGA